MKKKLICYSILVAIAIMGFSCGDDDPVGPSGSTILRLTTTSLFSLSNGYHYEGWAIIGGAAVSTGKFNISVEGRLIDLMGVDILDGDFETGVDLADATAIVITIEPDGDTDTVPAGTHILAGDVSGGSALLNVAHSSALGDDYATSGAAYILATPTDGADTNEKSGIWFLNPATTTFTMNFTGLEPLKNGFHYEGWAIVDGEPVSTGKFNVGSGDDLVDLNDAIIPDKTFVVGGDLSAATAIVLTIEQSVHIDGIPSATHIMSGDVTGGASSLSVGHASALGNDFSTATGTYILATPTNGADTNENSGIWFLDPSGAPDPGLQLPVLPAGWKYEGWTVINGTPVTTGTFTAVDAIDEADPYSGTQAGPPFPGEDFLTNAPEGLTFPTDIAGGTAVISIEPSPDDDPAPFTLKPLAGLIPTDAVDHVAYTMDNNIVSFPTGTVTITFNATAAGLTLPVLPAGWKYEGWVVMDGVPVTTGTFTAVDAIDEADPYSGTQAGPPFPGEDFLVNAPAGLTFPTDIAGMTAVISIEPSPDDAVTPFFLKPLTGTIPADATDHIRYNLDNMAASFPTMTATIRSSVASAGYK